MEVPLSSKKFPGLVALVDDADFDAVMQFKWHPYRTTRVHGSDVFYVGRKINVRERTEGSPQSQGLHRFLLNPDDKVDHKDGDGLNNQRSNLRLATVTQNTVNRRLKLPGTTSRFRGVSWNRKRNLWEAHIRVNKKLIRIGRFSSEEDAARAYDASAILHFGEFANPNFL